MGHKLTRPQLKGLFQESDAVEDKKAIDALKARLSEKISRNVKYQKKAAVILENWINKKGR